MAKQKLDNDFEAIFDQLEETEEKKIEEGKESFESLINSVSDSIKDMDDGKDLGGVEESDSLDIPVKKDEKDEKDEEPNVLPSPPEPLFSKVESEPDINAVEKIKDSSRELRIVDGKIEWMTDSPSGLYDSFYRKKKEIIKSFLIGGQLPFDEWVKELLECNVDTTSEVFDSVKYVKQMDEIQQMRQRVKNIQLKCNNQYFILERFIGLIRGSLARIQYLKPQAKQNGLIYEHLKDIELYFSKLKTLFNSSHEVMKTLDGAYDSLSRKATITMPLKSGDRYKSYDSVQVDNSGYDTLPEAPKIKNSSKKEFRKSGIVDDWEGDDDWDLNS